MSINASFVGRLTKDAEIKVINSKNALAFSVATDTGYGDKKSTVFFNCLLYRNPDGIAPYMVKGTQVFVSGEFSMKAWTNKEGKEISSPSINVNIIDLVGSKATGASSDSAPAKPAAKKPVAKNDASDIPSDEDTPF